MKFRLIEEKFVLPNQRIGLRFAEGWVFLRTMGRELLYMGRPFTRGFSLVGGDATLTPVELKDDQNNPMFDITSAYADRMLYHVGIGISPRSMRVYPEYPSGRRLGRTLAFTPTALADDRGYFTGDDSPYEAPTEAMEFMFPYKTTATFGFHNVDPSKKALPAFSVLCAKYTIEILNPGDTTDADIIGKMARGTAAFYPFQIGPPENLMEYLLKPDWNIEPITLKEARELGIVKEKIERRRL